MFILDFLSEGLRSIALLLDSVAFSLLGSIYGLFSTIASLSLIDEETISSVINNMYVVVGIFAFFRIAVLLINAMITPDALAKQGAGLSKIAVNTVIMIVLLVFTPTLFSLSRDVSKKIVDGHYIEKVFFTTDTNTSDPSNAMERIAVGALITADDQFLDMSEESKGKLVPNGDCTGDCEKAVYCLQDINGINYETDDNGNYVLDENDKKKKAFKGDCLDENEGIIWSKLSDYNSVTKKKKYVYNYKPFILTIVGWVMAYVLLSFTFDVAKRMVELAILEILAPLFIATIVDPKSMKTGTFKKWLKTLGSSYVSLFIRQASVAILLLCAKLLMAWTPAENANVGFFGKLIILLGVLIFAKGFPKWISNMVGLDGEAGLGGLSLKKKLASAALVGGAFQKASDSVKKYASQKGKNFVANRLRNTAAGIGGMIEQAKANKNLQKEDKKSLWGAGIAAAKQSRADNWGQNAQGIIKDLGAGYMAGRLNVTPDAKSINDTLKGKAQLKAQKANDKIENSDAQRALALERIANNKEAKKMYKDNVIDSKTGDRIKLPSGAYLNPRGAKEMNEAFGNPTSEAAAYKAFGENLAQARGLSVVKGKVVDSTGNIVSNSVEEYGASNMTFQGKLAVKQLVADNTLSDFENYKYSITKGNEANLSYTQAVSQLTEIQSNLQNSNPEYHKAQITIKSYAEIEGERSKAKEDYLSIINNSDYQFLSQNSDVLNEAESKRLDSYKLKLKTINQTVNECNTKLMSGKKEYVAALSTADSIEKSIGIQEMKVNVEKSRKQLEAWNKEIQKYETKFENAEKNPPMAFDDEGNIKVEGGKVVCENPYTVKVKGEKLNPLKDITRFEEIGNALATKASKAKSKYDDSMKEPTSNK